MSYDIRLKNPETDDAYPVQKTHIGGTMPLGGYSTTDFNITYNYGTTYYKVIDKEKGIRWLYDKTGKETIDRLVEAIKKLGTLASEDYWEDTEGNAGSALVPLLEAAINFPEGIWEGD